MNIKDLIAEVREHHRRATPGPWRTVRMDCGDYWGVEIVGPNGEQVTGETRITSEDRDVVVGFRTAAPLLADEVERLNAENATLRSNLQSIEHALSTRRKPGETLEWTIAQMFADLDRAEQERTAIRAAVGLASDDPPFAVLEEIRRLRTHGENVERLNAANEELLLTLYAEQGLNKGAPSPVWRHQGQGTWHNVNTGSVVQRGGWPVTMPGESTWTRPNGTHGTAENARAAMKAADAA